jgi:serine/threonine-protein kinase RsbW
MSLAEKLVEISIGSKLELIDVVTLSSDHLCKLAGFDEEEQYRVNLSVRETLANAIEHGNKFADHKRVEIQLFLNEEFFRVSIRDHGDGFDPNQVPNPLDPQNILNPDGRGILYMRSFMDEVNLIRHDEGGMQVTLTKNRISVTTEGN